MKKDEMSKNRRVKRCSLILFALLFALSVADYCITVWGINRDTLVEANPVMRFILDHTGFWTGLTIKQLMILPVGVVVYWSQRHDVVLWYCVALYVGVVTWNIVGVF